MKSSPHAPTILLSLLLLAAGCLEPLPYRPTDGADASDASTDTTTEGGTDAATDASDDGGVSADVEVCVPTDCETAGWVCGEHDDGCGKRLDCGGCESGSACNEEFACEACEASETCNGVDDDCDGIVDDGCPEDVETGSESAFDGERVGNTSGTAEELLCPQGTVMVGARMWEESYMRAVGGVCASPLLTEESSGWRINHDAMVVTSTMPAKYGGQGGTKYRFLCDEQGMLTRLSGDDENWIIDDLRWGCWNYTVAPDLQITAQEGAVSECYDGIGCNQDPSACPEGSVAVGLRAWESGGWLVGLEMICHDLELVVIPEK